MLHLPPFPRSRAPRWRYRRSAGGPTGIDCEATTRLAAALLDDTVPSARRAYLDAEHPQLRDRLEASLGELAANDLALTGETLAEGESDLRELVAVADGAGYAARDAEGSGGPLQFPPCVTDVLPSEHARRQRTERSPPQQAMVDAGLQRSERFARSAPCHRAMVADSGSPWREETLYWVRYIDPICQPAC
jgi:hypothetical protein